jgi:hypothetical protein
VARPGPAGGRLRTLPGPAVRRIALTAPLDRRDALRVLQLPPAADERAVKRAYRRLARTHHPDVGGEVATFHELQLAYEVLLGGDDGGVPVVPAGRPSRPREAWSSGRGGPAREDVDLATIAWEVALPRQAAPLSRDLIARWLAADGGDPVRALTATSRAPGSRLNRAAPKLSSDLTASLAIGPATDDRGRLVVAARLTGRSRRARKALDAVGLDGGWIRRRGTASTTLRHVAVADAERRVTALRTADGVVALLERSGWDPADWTLTRTAADRH